ncbi:MAG: 4-hydroxybutyrate CoA-transferase [Tepidiforma sp.]|nr:MAG: 4-hydroxybutyrate CoA-transferase [Tepidiforma sp.]
MCQTAAVRGRAGRVYSAAVEGSRYLDWPEEYAAKLMTAAEAAQLVRPGDTVVIPIGAITPNLCAALWERREELHDVDVLACAPFVDPGWYEPGHPAFRTHVELFNTAVARASMVRGATDFVSIPFSRRFKGEDERGGGRFAIDVVFVGVSPPDRFGYCSFGTSVWNKGSYARRARTVLAEVFAGYPRTGGDNRIHVSEIAAFVEGGELPPVRAARESNPFHPAMAGYVNELLRHGDTLQIGTGLSTLPLARAGAFDGLADLGVHSEVSIPGLNELVARGVITGARKTVNPGKFVATALSATTEWDLEFIHENPVYELRDVAYTNDIQVIAAHENMVAINNAMTIDLTGQVAAESIGPAMWSGPGGQLEFVIGAMYAKGGRSITLLPAAAKDGTVSRIVAEHAPGTVVTVPRQFVDYVVTEYGVARLFGKSDRERAEELIAVAHPDHRSELRRALRRS